MCNQHRANHSGQTFLVMFLAYSVEYLRSRSTQCLALEACQVGNGESSHRENGINANTQISRLFLFEGLVTIVYAVVIWFCLPDCKHSNMS